MSDRSGAILGRSTNVRFHSVKVDIVDGAHTT